MRSTRFALILALLLSFSVKLPAHAQEPDADPKPGTKTTYLPFVNMAAMADNSEILQQGMITYGVDPVFDAPVKMATVEEAPVQGPPPPPDPDAKQPQADAAGTVAPAAIDGWTTILNDGFETVPWPFAGWSISDLNGSSYGTYYWDDDDYRPYRGGWSAWPANGGPVPLDPAVSNYPNYQRTWMIYGPFDLSDAAKATLTFQYWAQTERNYDWFGWFASPNNSQFYGNWVSGDSSGWRPGVIDFAAVPGYGSMLGDGSVWIGFYFYSDGSTTMKGPFVDDVFLQKFNCPGQFTAYWYNSTTRTPTTQRAVTCETYPFTRNWSTSAPIWLSTDNWSLYMTARPYFNATRNWTFEALSDDGVRVWVDSVAVIDKWFDQGATTTYRVPRYMMAGTHNVVVEYYDHTGPAQLNVRWY